ANELLCIEFLLFLIGRETVEKRDPWVKSLYFADVLTGKRRRAIRAFDHHVGVRGRGFEFDLFEQRRLADPCVSRNEENVRMRCSCYHGIDAYAHFGDLIGPAYY